MKPIAWKSVDEVLVIRIDIRKKINKSIKLERHPCPVPSVRNW